jgi:hypothetical protein
MFLARQMVGRLLDPQTYRSENFGTSIILRETDYDKPKVEVVIELLGGKLKTEPLPVDNAALKPKFDGQLPDIILAGLDEVDPRHQVQQLWPSLVIDGAVGADLSCQVSCHPWKGSAACLLCVFQNQPTADLAELNSKATGLPSHIANDPDAIVTEQIIAKAEEEKKSWLRCHLGKRICSITSEAIVKLLSDEKQKEGFAPAVPFVACFSSCMIVTELVRFLRTGDTKPQPRFQLNLLWGPQRGIFYDEDRRETCFCVERTGNIARVREQRGAMSVRA